MPFTHSYSSPSVGNGSRAGMAPSSSTASINSTTSPSSSRHAASSHTSSPVDSPAPSEPESSRSRLFSSGRKSPDPFRRFRRLSSNNSLKIATATPNSDAAHPLDSHIPRSADHHHVPTYPTDKDRPASPSPLHTPRSAPPPLPSPSSKPALLPRPKRTKSSSISILSAGLGLRSRDSSSSPSTLETRLRHRKSASLSASDADFSSSTIEPPRSTTPQPMLRAASPSPSLSESVYSVNHEPAARATAMPPPSLAFTSKQHKQAWYQAQQKTIELENPNNCGTQGPNADTAKLFPINVATTEAGSEKASKSPADARSPRPVVETFLSEEEMLAAGIHIIRRRSDDKKTENVKEPSRLASTPTPSMPPRLYGADHPDFLELIDSPLTSKQPSPLLEQLADLPIIPSVDMHRTLSHSHAKSSSGSTTLSSAESTDYLPGSANAQDNAFSLNNGSTTSLSSGSKHSFSFAKLRRAGTKQKGLMGLSRPSTASSSSEDVNGSNRGFLFPSQSRQQSQTSLSSSGTAPGSLTPGPGSSASPFLNKHSATVGRASGSGHSARNGLAATLGPSSSSAAAAAAAAAVGGGGVPPPKPPKPKPSLLAAFPRAGQHSVGPGPKTAPLENRQNQEASSGSGMLKPPGSAGLPNGVYRSLAHSRSQEAVAEARLDAEALRASAGTPMPPPRRLNPSRVGVGGGGGGYGYGSTAMGRGGSGSGGVVGALGQVGQIGAAMGRKGWDFMKTLQNNSTAAGRSTAGAYVPSRPGNPLYPSTVPKAENEATRQWLRLLEAGEYNTRSSGGVFGAPLKDAVLRSRLSALASCSSATLQQDAHTNGNSSSSGNQDHLGVPDLGKEFSAAFLDSPRVTPRASLAVGSDGLVEPASREEARHLYLPRVVVRCVESLEKWGPSEEGIYRVSGRSSHTNKLRAHLSDPKNDLNLADINPAELDINSVCSVLKSYLRELPDTLIPPSLGVELEEAVARLLADVEVDTLPNEGGGGKVSDARAAKVDARRAEDELAPIVRRVGVYEWYLLRELVWHLGALAEEGVVKRTKMPLSNLTLVLAPSVQISLAVLQVLVRKRDAVFSRAPLTVGGDEIAENVEVEAKNKKGSSASRLPVLVRKRASSAALFNGNPSPAPAVAGSNGSGSGHMRTFSVTPSSASGDPYSRPSTSLGHFASPRYTNSSSSSDDSPPPRWRSRDDATTPTPSTTTPIARYYARIRHDTLAADATSSSPPTTPGRSGRTSALDRPRPPTGSSGRFFAGSTGGVGAVGVRRKQSLSASTSANSIASNGSSREGNSGIPRLTP